MKTTKLFLIIALSSAMVFISACNCIQGEGPVISQTRDLSGFTEIELDMGADIILTQDTGTHVTVEAQQNLMDLIETKVTGQNLKISFREGCYISDNDVVFYIRLPELTGIQLDGSGDISTRGAFNSEDVDFQINGSGTIEVDMIANHIKTGINGSGSVLLKGSSQKFHCNINGSGTVHALGHTAYKAYVDVTGSGDCEIYAHDLLEVDIMGSGTVYYSGNPEIKSNVKGSGTLVKK